MIDGQLSIFDVIYEKFKIDKPIRLIELFGGYGSQALALKYLGVKFEHWKLVEWAVKSIQAYKDIHFFDDDTDYSKGLTKEEIINGLHYLGISQNYNEPMKLEQIKKLNENELRKIYNNIIATCNLVNIQKVNGDDLEIVDTDKYCYIMTYSFPCQDLSLAGKGKGMSDTTTRSGMLWEVERILSECKDKPQVLLMENVPQVHSVDNLEDFNKWKDRLEELGYKNYFQDLIATDYGIPQTRNRCFMVSILGEYTYTFPKPIQLKLKLKDVLEDNVDEKFFLSDKMINYIYSDTNSGNYNRKQARESCDRSIEKGIACTITTTAGNKPTDNFIKIKNANSKGYLEATDGDGVDISSRMEYHRGTVQKGKTQTLSTMGGENNGVVVGTYDFSSLNKFLHGKERFDDNSETFSTLRTSPKEAIVVDTLRKQLCNELIQNNKVEENDVIKINYTTDVMNGKKEYKLNNNISPTLTTASNDEIAITNNLRIRKLTPKECFRLMGVKDEDYEKCAKNQSNSSLYHLAGDSIVVNVLMAIFREML